MMNIRTVNDDVGRCSAYRMHIQEREIANGLLSTLTINRAQIEDTGNYICIASNNHGQVERDFKLTVQGRTY